MMCLYNRIKFFDIPRRMPKRAETQVRKRIEASGQPAKIDQLCLDGIEINCISPSIKKLIQGCPNIEYLTLNDCSLKSLDNFPNLKVLIGLELQDNMLVNEDLPKLAHAPQIHFINISNNRISSIQALNQLKVLPHLEIIHLEENELCDEENYRSTIFSMLPNLQVIDCIDRFGNHQQEENPSEYISNIGNSRLDLLEDNEELENQEQIAKTNVSYTEEKGPARSRKSSLQASVPLSPTYFNRFQHLHRNVFPQRGFMNFKKGWMSSDSQQDELVKNFQKKFQKKQ